MRVNGTQLIHQLWQRGGPFLGEHGAPHARVTVEPTFYLTPTGTNVGTFNKGPIRSFQNESNSQVEVEVPNVTSISIDRSLDTDAATCKIRLINLIHQNNTTPNIRVDQLGESGYYGWNHGQTAEAQARWGHQPNFWGNVLVPNTLIRVYGGYGGRDKTISQAVTDGNIIIIGLFLVDEVITSAAGSLELNCRDTARLLIDQICFPPLVPESEYPFRRCRFKRREEVIPGIPGTPGEAGVNQVFDRRATYGDCTNLGSANSGSDVWYGPNAAVYGHRASHAFDNVLDSFWMSVGNGNPRLPFALEWIEICCGGEEINIVYIDPKWGNYQVFISVYEDGGWVDGPIIDYDAAGIGLYTGANTANIPYIMQAGVPWERAGDYRLPRTYRAQKIRLSFTNLVDSQLGTNRYRAAVREVKTRYEGVTAGIAATEGTPDTTISIIEDGNYFDYTDVVKDLLLYAGFWLEDAYDQEGRPAVFGNIESTGIYAEDCIPDEVFDKKPIIDILKVFRDIVGYILFTDEEGACHFRSPNLWGLGNFDEFGVHTTEIPEIDEKLQITSYGSSYRGRSAVSEIIISSENPNLNGQFNSTVTTRFVPPTATLLKGIVKPFGWSNSVFMNPDEQRILAELVAMQIFFQLRQGTVTVPFDPHMQIDDQVRIFERATGESSIHYIRGISTNLNLVTGEFVSTLTTHWLGDHSTWAITKDSIPTGDPNQFNISPGLQSFLDRTSSRAVSAARLQDSGGPTVIG